MAEEEKNETPAEPETAAEPDASATEAGAEEVTPEAPATEPAADEAGPEPTAEERAPDEAGPEPAADEIPEEVQPVEEAVEPGEAEPLPEEVPAQEPAASAETEPAPATAEQPSRKKKRVPRAERAPRTRPKRERPKARRPIVRLPKPEHERGRRQERRGVVVSSAMDKTIVVKVDTVKAHRRYKKIVKRSSTFHAHDEENAAKVGDVVRIVETRPLSKLKRWRLAEVVEAAK
jgi:small subunit ribosomal protein S17